MLDLFAKRRLTVWGRLSFVRLLAIASALCALSANGQTPVNVTPPNLQNAVAGSLPGSVSVDNGSATYSLAFPVPPGTAGLAPKVGLSYDSRSSDGWLGTGWSITGTSSIRRCGKNVATDGTRNAVALTTDDEFCLDGQRLVRIDGGVHGTATYRTEVDQFTWIKSTASTSVANGPLSWEVRGKDGLILKFGATSDSRIEAQGKSVVISWALARIEDRRGNYANFVYEESNATGEHRLSSIRYTGNALASPVLLPYNAINFIYEDRPDVWSGWIKGSELQRNVRLANIQARINIAADGTGGTLVRDWRVGYTTNATSGRSLVDKIEDCDGAGTCLPATTFTWTTRNTAHNTIAAAGSGDWGGPMSVAFENEYGIFGNKQQQLQSMVLPVDLNGDGLTDLLHGNGTTTWRVCISSGSAFSCTNWTGPARESRYVQVGDFDGDGRTDIAVPPSIDALSTWQICRSTGTGFSCSNTQAQSYGSGIKPSRYVVADFTNDGRDDLLAVGLADLPNTYPSWLCPSVGSGFGTCFQYPGAEAAFANEQEAAARWRMTRQTPDLNGDGRPDVARFVGPQPDDDFQTPGRIELFVSGETGVTPAGGFISKASRLDLLQGLSIWGDSNGDPYDPYADYHYGWIGTAETCRYTGAGANCKSQAVGDSGVWNILDYDSDGRADVLAGGSVAGNRVRQTFGDGTRSTTDVAWTGNSSLPTSLWVLRGDFNGDGIPDIAYYIEETSRWSVHLYGYGSFPGLLASVTNGLGHVTKVQYAGMNDRSVYTPGTSAVYPNRDLTQGPPVVKLLQVSNGLGGNLEVAYKYSGLRTHLTGRGSLGFQKITVEDRVANTTTVTTYSQAWPTIGMALGTSVTHDSGVVLTQSTNTLSHFLTTDSPLVRHAYVSKSVTTRKDLNGSLIGTTTSEIDTNGIDKTYGNVIASTETVADANNQTFTTKTATEFSNDDTNILWGLPTQISVSKSATGTPTIKRTTGRSYESPYGQLKTQTIEPDDASTSLLKFTTTYTRNPTFGQVTEKKLTWYDPVAQATKSRTVESVTAFDAKYRWPTTVKNAKLHAESATYSEAHGQPLSETDPNLLKTSWQYDGWGRKIREDRPDKTAATWAYRKCTDLCGYSARGVVANITQQWARVTLAGGTVEEQQTTVPTEVYLDVLGREVGTRTWGLTETIHTDRVFDANGRLVKLSRPHTLTQRGNGAYGWTEYIRDELGRVKLMKATDRLGTGVDTTIFSYSGLTRTLTDANAGKRIEVRNGIGKITAITDALSNTVGYTYNAFGELLSTTDPLANQIKVEYDRLGRKTKLTDPDLGTWTYKVDPLGQTYEQTDARVKKTSFSFDELGRVTRKLETDADNNWIYDTAASGIGELAESYTLIDTNKDYRRIHSYDSYGRPSSTQTNLDWEYATLWTYDNYSRPKTESHRRRAIGATSGGVEQKVEFSYNRQGQVEKLFRSGSTTPMWTNRAQDALGRTTDELLDNTLETVRSFNAYTGRLETIRAGQDNAAAGSTATHQNDTYTYDPVGNLLTRAHLNATSGARHTETFTYDALNRLKSAQVNGQPMRNFDYDALGNLTSKTGVGSFSYEQPAPVPMTMIYIDDDLFFPVPIKLAGGTPPPPTANVRPHAVKAITGNVAGVSNPRLSYDANGNLLAGLGRSYGWSGGNLPLTIDRQAGGIIVERTEFTYGPDRQRTRQIRRAMSGTTPGAVQNTVYYGDGIEKEIDVAKNQTLIRTYLPQGIGYLEEVITGTAVPATATATANARYLLKDYLGSPILVTDASRSERQRMSYDAWGRRRQATGADDSWSSLGTISNGQDNTGYTGHEQLDTLGLVHMNERLYDPILGRHVSADPTVPDPADLQSLNRYTYVLNNALAFVDPTGLGPEKASDTKPPEVDGGDNPEKQRRYDSERCTGSRLCATVAEVRFQFGTLPNGDSVVIATDALVRYVSSSTGFNNFVQAIQSFVNSVIVGGYEGHASESASQQRQIAADSATEGAMQAAETAATLTPVGAEGQAAAAVVKVAPKIAKTIAETVAAKAAKRATGLPGSALVCRGGTCTADKFASGSGVTSDAGGKLQGVSVNSGSGKTVEQLSVGIPNKQVGVTTVGDVRRAGGDVISSPTANNLNHCTLCGITPQQAEQLMTPTIRNPNVR